MVSEVDSSRFEQFVRKAGAVLDLLRKLFLTGLIVLLIAVLVFAPGVKEERGKRTFTELRGWGVSRIDVAGVTLELGGNIDSAKRLSDEVETGLESLTLGEPLDPLLLNKLQDSMAQVSKLLKSSDQTVKQEMFQSAEGDVEAQAVPAAPASLPGRAIRCRATCFSAAQIPKGLSGAMAAHRPSS